MKSHRLIGSFKGFWSRRINDKDRLIYKIDEGAIYIISCRQHYTDLVAGNIILTTKEVNFHYFFLTT